MQEPEIIEIEEKKLVGIKVSTSLANDKTSLLWKRFMQSRDAIKNNKNDDLFSVQIYGEKFINEEFDSQSVFEKWAAMETQDHSFIPKGLQALEIPAGLYAVFVHHGTAKEFAETSKFIFQDWLPASDYNLDNRPHFEVLGEEYKGPEDPDSKEKIWIPIKSKN
ncbi:GyrI-like domain-containing protein [Gramella jeungdoensis]|uniref:GyrI-like domain-containing protein n=1 Tax=Gramella jeungdoensis TaxID=708091 RepID=A0ABT0Z2Q4_9FLAO|nr:GyrI-like domain-containing protein [Gramella jeungdoensis]MCM8569989.1 GyrI-like domain-containing protein [Gramella jeungdoensis]